MSPNQATIRKLTHRFEHWISHEDWTHAREKTRFYLDVVERPALARRLAEINLTIQQEPEDRMLALRTGLRVADDQSKDRTSRQMAKRPSNAKQAGYR